MTCERSLAPSKSFKLFVPPFHCKTITHAKNTEHYILFAQKLTASRHHHQLLLLPSPTILLNPLILSIPTASGLAQTTAISHWAVSVRPIYPTSTPASSSLPSLAFQNTSPNLASWLKGSQRCPQPPDYHLCGAPLHSTLPARPLLLWLPGSRGAGSSSRDSLFPTTHTPQAPRPKLPRMDRH